MFDENGFSAFMNQSDPPHVVTIGEESVGKTSITSRLIDDEFDPYEQGTVGANYQQYSEIVDGQKIVIQIWDTAGQEKFKSLGPIYFRNAAAAVCVFSLTSKSSFDNMRSWIDQFQEVAGNSAIIYIAANKTDLKDDFEVTMEEAEEWANSQGMRIFATSAKTGDGVKEMFKELAHELYRANVTKVGSVATLTEANKKGCC